MPQVHFLPWAGITTTIKVGRVTIEPWRTVRTRLARPAAAFLASYFARYRTNTGSAVRDIALAFLGNDPIADLSVSQRHFLRRAVDALTFASLLPDLLAIVRSQNPSFGVARSERFQLITQLFQTGQTSIGVVSGGIMQVWGLRQIHFCAPWCVGSGQYRTDEELLKALGCILNGGRGAPLRERLFRALEWFRLAHAGSDDMDDSSRLVMMATAFEVLLEPPNPFQKRSAMGEALTQLTHDLQLKTANITIAKKQYTFTAPAVWLDAFYQVRNSIVHGDKVKQKSLRHPLPGRPWLTHLHLADFVMWEIVLWELVAAKLVAKHAAKTAAAFAKLGSGRATLSLIRTITADSLGIDGLHRSLSWIK